jgi:polysaccharide lyase-like protein
MRYLNFIRFTMLVLAFPMSLLLVARAPGQDAPATQPAAPPVFTEDFESGVLNKDVWTQKANTGATITIQQDVVAHGKNALLVHYPAGVRSYGFIVASHLPDSLKDHFFGRAYVQFPKAPPNAHDVFITAGTAGWPVSNFLEIGLRRNKAQLSYQQNGAHIPRGETMIPGPAYPVGKWFCLEWEFNDDPDAIVIWIDGKKTTDAKVAFKGTADHLVNGFVEFGFGFRSWGNVPNGFDVYYDDIALGTERIGPVK